MRVFFVLGMLMPFLHGIVRAQSTGMPISGQRTSAMTDSSKKAIRGDSTSRAKVVELQSIVVAARKPLIEQKIDRTIVNVDALISNTGTNALEVLAGAPGLQVDDDGAITLKGKSGVLVLIDGRPTQLSGADLANYLKTLPSGVLDKIEIMSNPPARYAAAGTGGIINIKTKRSKASGFSGSMTGNIGVGAYGSSNNSFNFSYRRDKLNLFGDAGLSVQNNYFQSDRLRSYTYPDGTPSGALQQRYYESSNRVAPGGRLGMDYSFSKTAILGIVLSGVIEPYVEKGDYRSWYLNAGGNPDSSMYVNSRLRNNWKNGDVDINFRHPMGATGKELTAGLNYHINGDVQDQLLSTSVYTPDHSLKSTNDLLLRQTFSIKTYTGNADYTQPVGKHSKIETGWRTSIADVNNLSAYSTRLNSSSAIDSSWSSPFLYRETVHALYGNLTREWHQFSVQAGLRMENTISRGQVPGDGSKIDTGFTRRYTNLFPTAFFSYHTDSLLTHQFFLTGGRRINRPDYGSLNPSRFFSDRHTIITGNPLLRPEFSYNAELSHVYKQNLTTALEYSDTRDLIMQTYQQQGDYFVNMPMNIGRVINWGINSGASIPLRKWWKSIVYAEYDHYQRSTSAGGLAVNPTGHYWRLSINNQFRWGNGWSTEISGFYRSKGTQVQSIAQSLWYANATIQKKLWKDAIILNLGWRDIFHTKIYKRELNTLPGQTVTFVNTQDTRVLYLSVTCKFGKTGSKKTSQQTSDPKADIDRLKRAN
jgi:outer membrane receptor protein involved in Fe transport